MSVERLRERQKLWLDEVAGTWRKGDRIESDEQAEALNDLIESSLDAIALLADFGDAVRKQTDEYDEAEVRRSWPDAPILAIFDLLTRLDALCGDAHA